MPNKLSILFVSLLVLLSIILVNAADLGYDRCAEFQPISCPPGSDHSYYDDNCICTACPDEECKCPSNTHGSQCQYCDIYYFGTSCFLKCDSDQFYDKKGCQDCSHTAALYTTNCFTATPSSDQLSCQCAVCEDGFYLQYVDGKSTCVECDPGFGGQECHDCTQICYNNGVLDEENCECHCSDGFSGVDCQFRPSTCDMQCQSPLQLDEANCQCVDAIRKIEFTTLPPHQLEAGGSYDLQWQLNWESNATETISIYLFSNDIIIAAQSIDDDDNNDINNNNDRYYYNDFDDELLFITLQLSQPQYKIITLTPFPLSSRVSSTTLIIPTFTKLGTNNVQIRLVVNRNNGRNEDNIQIESEPFSIISPCGCKEFEICIEPRSSTPTCQCKPGYSRKDSNINNPCELLCNEECYINGECIAMKDKVGKVIGSRCKCKDVTQWGGENCSISLQQQCYEKDQLLCFGHGTTYNSKTNRCDHKCICDNINRWFGDNCNECYLTKSSTSLIQCDPIGTDNQLTNQICSTIIGQECICQPGYSGSLCQYRTIYGTLTFIRSLSLLDEEPKYIINYESLSPLQQLLKVNTTTQLFLQQLNLEYLSIEGKFILERDLLLSFPIDQQEYLTILVIGIQQNKVNDDEYNINVTFSITFNPNPNQLQSPPSPFSLLQTDPPPTLTTPPTINDIYDSWPSLQTTFTTPPSQQPQQHQPPIKSTEVSQEIGQPNGIEPVYDPKCDSDKCLNGQSPFSLQTEEEIKGNDNNNKTNVGMIIGIVIGIIVGVILLFVIVIISVRYCKKNEKCCFAKRSSTARSRSGLNNNNKTNTNKSATTTSTLTSTTEMSQSTSNSDNSNNSNNSNTNNDRSTKTSAVDLIEVMNHGEKLPDGWSKQQHTVTGEIFYVNNDKMISQRHSPIDGIGGDTAASQW